MPRGPSVGRRHGSRVPKLGEKREEFVAVSANGAKTDACGIERRRDRTGRADRADRAQRCVVEMDVAVGGERAHDHRRCGFTVLDGPWARQREELALDAGLRLGADGLCFPFPFPCLPRGWRRKRHRETARLSPAEAADRHRDTPPPGELLCKIAGGTPASDHQIDRAESARRPSVVLQTLKRNKHARDRQRLGRGGVGKAIVAGAKQRGGRIKAQPVPATDRATLRAFMEGGAGPKAGEISSYFRESSTGTISQRRDLK